MKKENNIPCIEYSIDHGQSWAVWVYYNSGQIGEAKEAFHRLECNMPEWIFRIVHTAKTNNPAAENTFRMGERLRKELVDALKDIVSEQIPSECTLKKCHEAIYKASIKES